MSFPKNQFLLLDDKVSNLIKIYGFELSNRDYSGPFGSLYSEYSNDKDSLSLIWDAKEGWLSLIKRSHELSKVDLTELFFERFPRLSVPISKYEDATNSIIKKLEDYFKDIPVSRL